MTPVLILGGTTYDHIIYLEQFPSPVPQTIHEARFQETTGSTGSGKAICLRKLEVPSSLYSILGDDLYGHRIINDLQKAGVDFKYDIDPAGTERHVNLMNAAGNRISMFITQSSTQPSYNQTMVKEMINSSGMLVLNIIAYCKGFIPLLKNYTKPIWTDLHDYTDKNPYHEPFIETATTVFLSSDNLADHKHTMQELISRGKQLVICTHGGAGSTALTAAGEWFDQPALSGFSMVDTNGAGDNYFAGFLYARLRGKSIRECMRYGTICGALCITSAKLVAEELSASLLEQAYRQYY